MKTSQVSKIIWVGIVSLAILMLSMITNLPVISLKTLEQAFALYDGDNPAYRIWVQGNTWRFKTALSEYSLEDLGINTGAGGANTALSNLASVAINTSLIPNAANTYNLGSSSIGWKHLYLDNANTTAPTTNGQINYNSTNTRFEAYGNGAVTTTVPVPVTYGDILYVTQNMAGSFTIINDTGAQYLGHVLAGSYVDQVAMSFQVSSTVTNVKKAQVHIWKNGSPGNITIRIETDNAGNPSGTLVHANATATILAVDVGTSAWYEVIFSGNFTLNSSTTYHLVEKLSSDPGSGNNYLHDGDHLDSYINGSFKYHPNDGSWTAGTGILDMAFKIILDVPATWSILTSAANGVLVTDSDKIPSVATNIPTAVTIGSNYIYRVGGTDVAVADGGTGRSSSTTYMPLCGGTTTTAAHQSVATGTQYYPLCYNTSSSLPSFQLLPVAGGGTGLSSYTANNLLYASGTTTIAGLATANNGVMVTSGTGVPSIAQQIVLNNCVTGTRIYIADKEAQNSLTANGVGIAYTLAANTYALIKVAAEGYLVGAANTASTWNIWIRDNGVQKGNKTVLDIPATGAGDTFSIPFNISTIFAETTSQSLDVYGNEIVDGATCVFNRLEIEGIR